VLSRRNFEKGRAGGVFDTDAILRVPAAGKAALAAR
jgi:hypothetical protein